MSDQHKLNIGSSNTYNHVYWGFLYHADNVDILLNTYVHDIKFAFRDANCTQLIEFYSNQNYYVANDGYLYVCCSGILSKGIHDGKLQTWSI